MSAAEPEHGMFAFDDWNLHYEIYGEGDRLLVFLHGLLIDNEMNRGLASALAARGNRVALLDLLGHGKSDKATHASEYRMDVYGRQVIAFLDHLGVDRAVIGGVSLGANVSLQVALQAPERVHALVIEMPVLEWATPAAAMLFTPALLVLRSAGRVAGLLTAAASRLPRTPFDLVNSLLNAVSTPPEVITAVLHGILVGPVAPSADERRAIAAPALVIAHRRDLIHPFSDAENLVAQLQNARLESARGIYELRLFPKRLTDEIAWFLDDVWSTAPVPASRNTG
jgi:pimeloyl-ACP methyl ester carboxylesterase